MSAPPLTREVFRATMAQVRQRLESPAPSNYWIVHPCEAWWIALHGAEGWKWRRLKAFRQFWRYRKHFDDYHIMIVLSSIIRGEYP